MIVMSETSTADYADKNEFRACDDKNPERCPFIFGFGSYPVFVRKIRGRCF
jgi:hypothetical protein